MRAFITYLAFVALTACGGSVDKADQQLEGQLDLPDYRSQDNEPLALTGESGNLYFTGSLIVWDSAVTPAQIKRIGDASRGARTIKSEIATYNNTEIAPLRAEVASVDKSLEGVRHGRAMAIQRGYQNSDLVRTVLLPVAEGWFPKRVNELKTAGAIGEGDLPHINRMFNAYCEFKMWELALSPLASAKFLDRPTPLAMCEAYYKQKGYFTNAALCSESESGGQDYFSCLWNDGVLRSELFVSKLESTPCRPTPNAADYPSRGAAIKDWVAKGIIQKILADTTPLNDQKSFSEEFVTQSLAGTAYARQLYAVPDYAELGRCRIAFKREDLTDGSVAADDLWKFAKFDDLKFIIETTEDQASRAAFQLLPPTRSSDQDRENYKKLAWYVLAFAERKASTGRAAASYSDAKFNRVVGVTLTADPEHESRIRTDRAFDEFFNLDDRFVPADLQESFAALTAKRVELRATLADKEEYFKTELQGRLFANQQESIKSVMDPGATVLFNAFALNLIQTGSSMRVELKFADATSPLIGCLEQGAADQCESDVPGRNAGVTFDAESGRLTVTRMLSEPAAVGFMQREATEAVTYFSKIDEQALAGRTLQMEFDLNRLSSSLEFFTGTTYVKDSEGRTRFLGSQSGDNLSQRLSGK
jgi:hypothetical protein